jgi:hypothetical protein
VVTERLVGEFGDVELMRRAGERLAAEGYPAQETYSSHALGPRRHGWPGSGRLTWLALAGGLAGAALSYGIQYYTSVIDYPLNVGGRPIHAPPLFLLATVATAGLGAGVAVFLGLLVSLGLPRLWDPVFEIDGFEAVSVDRYFLGVYRPAAGELDRLETLLDEAGATRVVRIVEDS